MKASSRSKGPWTHRALVYFFTFLFGILVYWLLGFVVRDIATWPGPKYDELEKQRLSQQLVSEADALREDIARVNREIAGRKQRQGVLRDSTSNSQKTMDQLLGLQRLTLERGLTSSTDEVRALAESEKLFLANQEKYQEMNDQIAALNDELSELEARQRLVEAKLNDQRPSVREEYNRLQSAHQWRLAAWKLAFLLPLLGVAVWLFLKRRGTLYAPLIYGFGLALLLRVVLVMHEHFPRKYFKYVLILAALAVVARALIYLLRTMAFPKPDLLLKQYREAYEHFFCPICNYPIRRGPLKHMFWTRNSLKKVQVAGAAGIREEEAYTCPACATRLYEECPSCKGVRHALLPACVHCGSQKTIAA